MEVHGFSRSNSLLIGATGREGKDEQHEQLSQAAISHDSVPFDVRATPAGKSTPVL
jgi:hypothetical protein